jgi:hypothetical protein
MHLRYLHLDGASTFRVQLSRQLLLAGDHPDFWLAFPDTGSAAETWAPPASDGVVQFAAVPGEAAWLSYLFANLGDFSSPSRCRRDKREIHPPNCRTAG